MSKSDSVWFDGCIRAGDEPPVSLKTHSLHYGYGVIEGIRAYAVDGSTKLFAAEEHYDRLRYSAELIGLPPFPYDSSALVEATFELLDHLGLRDAYVRPIVFLGEGLGNLRDERPLHVAIMAWNWSPKTESQRSMRLAVSPYRRPDPQSFPSAAKSTGAYLLMKTATMWATDRGFDDAIILDHEGYISECTAQNIFGVKGGEIFTPSVSRCLAGITRRTVMNLAASMDLTVREAFITRDELLSMDEVFITSTASEVVPISHIDEVEFFERSMASRLKKAYRERVTA